MVFIYILELENKKYYIGKTTNPDFRLEQHFSGQGSRWTNSNKPKNILEIIPNCDDYDEDKYTLKYMEKYGINNVRGGTFCELKLNKDNLNTIKKMLNGSTDKCYICGKNGHFANDCDDDCNYEDIWVCECCDKKFTDENKCQLHENKCKLEQVIKLKFIDICKKCDQENCCCENKSKTLNKNKCTRCGRKGHYSNACYAKTNIDKEEISESSEEEIEISESSEEEIEISESSEEEIEIFCCSYCDKEFNTLKGVTCHENLYCKHKNNKSIKSNKNITSTKNVCYRCGRDGHNSNNCYASKHINGKYLS